MNTLSLNNLWSYLQGLSLTTNNKKWLAEHLYEDIKSEERTEHSQADFHISSEDLVLTPEILEPIKDIEPLPVDYDFNKARHDYIMQKYG